ncbi:hypothetical protein M422DRAFT_56528 [Sphaerobolus stellatus SS14]|uniref:Uncharacterized protein n=1 Tax=Sphaerobolus stellatus (strain SS14) TaxID=990650 RepID=A0A0C9T5H3_SPHS4|nr:hypothetical protein M422DRAFT_56528 [Sphaerobolus stellatus SS14]
MGALLFEMKFDGTIMRDWISYLAAYDGIDWVWVEELAATFVGDFSKENFRLGVFIDVKTFPCHELLCEMLQVHIPIWYAWCPVGCVPPHTHWTMIDDHTPASTDMATILTYYTKPTSFIAHP